MIIAVALFSALVCAVIAMIKRVNPARSSGLVQCIRFQLEYASCIGGNWVTYLITTVPVLIILALFSHSNYIILSLDILFLFNLILLVLLKRMQKSRAFSA